MIGRRSKPSAQETDKPKGFDDFELRLGDIMRGERATLSKSLLDVQRELRIKAAHIAAIENADVSAFETPSFIAGYVRSYARYLGLDAEWAFDRFCKEAGFQVAHGMSPAASGLKPGTALPRADYAEPLANPNAIFVPRGPAVLSRIDPGAIGSILVLVALIAGIGYGGFAVLKEVQKVNLAPVEQSPGVVAELDPLDGAVATPGGDAAAALPAEQSIADSEALDRLYRPQALESPVLVARDGPIAAIDPRTVGVIPAPPQPGAAQVAAADPAAAPVVPLGETPVQVVAADAPEVELLAVRPSWVRVQAADGTTIFEKILDAGERFALPKTEQPPVLRSGESGAIYFAVNGQTYGPAGDRGQVTKNIVLSPDALTGKYALADLEKDGDLAKFVAMAQAAPATAAPVPAGLDAAPAAPAASQIDD